MTPAVANLSLARDTDYDVALIFQDAAAQPLDLTGYDLAATLKAGDHAACDVAVSFTDAAAGLATVHVVGLPLGMYAWELWIQSSPACPRERMIRGLVTVEARVDPRAESNPATHRMIVRMSDAVRVSLDAVDLAWWAYESNRKLLGHQFAEEAYESASKAEGFAQAAQQSDGAAHTSSVHAAGFAVEAMRHRDAAVLSATNAAVASGQAGDAARTAVEASGAAGAAERNAVGAATAADDVQTAVERMLAGFSLSVGSVVTLPDGSSGGVGVVPGASPGAHVLNFTLVAGPQGDKGEPGTLTSNAGDVVIGGRLTANGATVNGQLHANGGVNIPVPPVTETDGVNRLYAAGLSAVMDAARIPLYLSKAKSTLTQGAFTEPAPGLVLSAPVAANSRQMLSVGLDYAMHAASNYSQGLGWILPLRSTVYGQLKVSVSYGHGVFTAASSEDMDDYEIYPTDESVRAYGAVMDIYLNQANIGGNLAAVRTRIIYYDLAVKMMMVRTVTAHVDINNTGLISTTTAIVYQQHSDTHGAARPSDYGSIWLIRNGLVTKNIVKIADVPGIHCFSGGKLNSPVLINGKAEDIYTNVINVGAPVMQLACGNGRNPAYYGFQALETNAVISMTTAPYEPPTNV